jgi:hypothetical protein
VRRLLVLSENNAGVRIQEQALCLVLPAEVEHVGQRTGQGVEGTAADAAQVPVDPFF